MNLMQPRISYECGKHTNTHTNLEGVTNCVMLFNEEGLQDGNTCPAIANISWNSNPILVMEEKAVFRYLELPIFESSNLMQPFFIAPVYSTSIPACIS